MDNKRLDFPSSRRNAGPIVQVLQKHVPHKVCSVLEIASGSGQHAVAFCEALPQSHWWPTDLDPAHIASINAWRARMNMEKRIHKAQILDVCDKDWRADLSTKGWPECFDVIVNINMIHISPWEATHGLMRGAAQYLCAAGMLLLYGPYTINGEHTAPSNAEFDKSLRARNPEWGVRDLDDIAAVARTQGLTLRTHIPMPANNFCVIFEHA